MASKWSTPNQETIGFCCFLDKRVSKPVWLEEIGLVSFALKWMQFCDSVGEELDAFFSRVNNIPPYFGTTWFVVSLSVMCQFWKGRQYPPKQRHCCLPNSPATTRGAFRAWGAANQAAPLTHSTRCILAASLPIYMFLLWTASSVSYQLLALVN